MTSTPISKHFAKGKGDNTGTPLPPSTVPQDDPAKYLAKKCSLIQRTIFFCALIISNDTKSGKEGNRIYSHNRYGTYVKSYAIPTDPQSVAQMAQRAAVGSQSQVWATLTSAQRLAWEALAATVSFVNRQGRAIFLTGQPLFNKLNRNLIQAGQSAITTAPAYTVPSAPLTIQGAAAVGAATHTATFTPSPVPAGVVYQIWASPSMSPGKAFVKGQFKFIANIAAAATAPQNIRNAYQGVYGVPTVGNTIWIEVRAVSITTGVASAFIRNSYVVAA